MTSRPPRSVIASSAVPIPYQPGRLARACDHANTHGIARSVGTSIAASWAPAPLPRGRDEGRDPSPSPLISPIGVAAEKNAANPGWSSSAR
jgi:hypothetical protein